MTFEHVGIDEVQEYWDRRPCNIRHSDKPICTKEYFDEVEKRKYFVEPHIPSHAEFEKWRGKKVLELGCGIGTDTVNFLRAGAKVTAVDLSRESLKVTRKRVSLFDLDDNFDSYHGNIEELRQLVPQEKYDLVYSFGVVHHTPNPETVVEQIKGYMTPGVSELRLMVYNRFSYKLFWMMKESQVWSMANIDSLIAKHSEAQTGCPVTYTYTPESVKELLAGFSIERVEKRHIFTWDIEEYKRYNYVKDSAWVDIDDKALEEMEKELGWHLLVRAKLDSTP